MSLVRVQYPSPNHSGPRPSSRLLVIHTSEGAQTISSLANWLCNPASQVSYQVAFDDRSPTEIGEYVPWNLTPWAAMKANSWGQHGCLCTPSGASANWSRQTWLNEHDTMIRAAAAWVSEEAARCQVALVKIGANEINAGRSGICGHGDVSAAGAGGSHFDPGDAFPFDVLIAYALGGQPFPTPQAEELVLIGQEWYPMSIFQSDDDARQAAVLTWWAQYLSSVPSVADLAHWSTGIKDHGYAGCLNMFLAEPNVKERMAARPW